jgi:asparagine synthetase B (glutamine-hydrolysing)
VPPTFTEKQNCRVAILFSGGLDCTVLARMAHDILPPEYEIDLINVAFENPRVVRAAKNTATSKKPGKGVANKQSTEVSILPGSSPYETCPDRETGRKAFQELQQVCPARIWRFIAVGFPLSEVCGR